MSRFTGEVTEAQFFMERRVKDVVHINQWYDACSQAAVLSYCMLMIRARSYTLAALASTHDASMIDLYCKTYSDDSICV